MIVCQELGKDYNGLPRVDNVSLCAPEGSVLGIVGPNGAGKSTTLRMILGLVEPTRGSALIDGRRYRDLPRPLLWVGASLDDTGWEPSITPRRILSAHASSNRVHRRRVDELLSGVGLDSACDRPIREFSLGMRRRVSLALALLGRPRHLIVDEPLNGMDPPSIAWLRGFLRDTALQGNAVIVASHMLTEQEKMCDSVVIMDGGTVVAQGPVVDLIRTHAPTRTLVEVWPAGAKTLQRIAAQFAYAYPSPDGCGALLAGDRREEVSHQLLAAGVAIRTLTVQTEGLEGVFNRLVNQRQEYRMGGLQ